jgi:hypothetical protein
MDFHGHEIDVDSAFRAIAMEFARQELCEHVSEQEEKGNYVGPQDKANVMLDAYFQVYGHLLGTSESYVRNLLSQNYPGD